MVLSSFLLLSFFLFLLVWSFFYLFSFWFFFLEFFLLCVRFPLSLFSYEKCFCAHVQTWALTCKHGRVDIGTMPIMSRMILVRGGKSGTRIRYRLGSLFAQFGPYGSGCAGSILAYRFGVGLSRYRRSCPGSDIGWWFVFQALWTRPVINGP